MLAFRFNLRKLGALIITFLAIVLVWENISFPERIINLPADPIKWGDVTNGLQLGVVQEKDAGYIHCWMRNGLTNNLKVNLYMIGSWEYVNVEVMLSGKPRQLERAPTLDGRAVTGIGPDKGSIRQLLPLEILEPSRHNGNIADLRLGSWKSLRDCSYRRVYLPSASPPAKSDATFFVDLIDFTWPAEALTNQLLQVRVTHWLPPVLDNYEFLSERMGVTVKSAIIEVDGIKLKTLINKLSAERPKNIASIYEVLGHKPKPWWKFW